jgi:hypothetical protein
MLPHLIFDCWIILDDVGEDLSMANLCQQLRDHHLLAIRVFQLERVPHVWRHNEVGVVVEGLDQQRLDHLVNLGVPLLAFGKRPEKPRLAGGQLSGLLDNSLFPFGQGALWNAKPAVTFSGKGALKVSITLAALRFLSVLYAHVFLRLQLCSIRREEC